MFKVITAREAAELVQDGNLVAFNGMVNFGLAEQFFEVLEQRFLETGHPNGISYMASTGFGQANRFAHKGMVRELIVGHWMAHSAFMGAVVNGEVEAYNLPQGVIALNYSAAAARVPRFLSRAGLKTSIDPRFGGGSLNGASRRIFSEVVVVDGKEYLSYRTIFPDVCVLRGTTADPRGNITFEREANVIDALAMAQAVRNNGGKVIAQVERLSDSLADPHAVVVPGMLVDAVYVYKDAKMLLDQDYDPVYSGERRIPEEEIPAYLEEKMQLNMASRNAADRIIARRAACELRKNDIVNLGTGVPMMVALEAYRLGFLDDSITFTIECGSIGGIPVGPIVFGGNMNIGAIVDQGSQFRFYEGGGIDITSVGALEIDREGRVNVMRSGDRVFGVGGFNHVTTSPKRLVFCSRFQVGSDMKWTEDRLTPVDGKASKFCEEVEYISFSPEIARENGQEVLYVTERCVLRLTDAGLELTELAPGLDLEQDVLSKLPFRPMIATTLETMPECCFNFGVVD